MSKRYVIVTVWAVTAVLAGPACLRYGEVTTSFDRGARSEVRSRTAAGPNGERVTLVRATINGTDPGWFMLASGSYFCIVDSRIVSRIEDFPRHNTIEIPFPCKLPVDIHRARTLRVGALTVKNLDVAAYDLSAALEGFEDEIVGMIGFPVFRRAAVRIAYGRDGADDRVSIHPPGGYERDGANWIPLSILDGQAVLNGRVNRTHTAPFSLDTGFGGGVSFYSVFAANHDVLEGRPTRQRTVPTVCGEARVLDSTVRTFEIAGRTYENLAVSITTPGSISDVGPGPLGGTIGRGFLKEFDVVFDCARGRIVFLDP